MKRICVYCGSNSGSQPAYTAAAKETGTLIARRGFGLVYGGASIGLMGATANAALAAGGEVIGIIPRHISSREIAHKGLSQLQEVDSMHERKALMERQSDAFLALPGGFGTLDELCEMITWAQLGLHGKPIALLNTNGYFDDFLRFLDRAVKDSFIPAEHRGWLRQAKTPTEALDLLFPNH